MSELYEKGNYNKALSYFKLFKEQDDSLKELASQSNILIVESRFRYEQLRSTANTLEEYARRDSAIINSQKDQPVHHPGLESGDHTFRSVVLSLSYKPKQKPDPGTRGCDPNSRAYRDQ